jgi:hypothetical protein
MGRKELSEPSDGWQTVRDEIRQSDERIDAMLRDLAESSRGHTVQTDGLIAATEAGREESRAFRRELRERIDRLPPPAQAA